MNNHRQNLNMRNELLSIIYSFFVGGYLFIFLQEPRVEGMSLRTIQASLWVF